jgi:hypothetical protein
MRVSDCPDYGIRFVGKAGTPKYILFLKMTHKSFSNNLVLGKYSLSD